MNQIAAIAKALIAGETLSIMDGFKQFSCSNIPREISRSIEKKFGASICREHVEYKSKYGIPGYYFRYRLNPLREGNAEAIKKMLAYIKENGGDELPKTERESKQKKNIEMMVRASNTRNTQQQLFV